MKFVQESIEEDKPSGKATFTMIEVRLLGPSSNGTKNNFFIDKFVKCLRFLVILIVSQIIALKSGCGAVSLDKLY